MDYLVTFYKTEEGKTMKSMTTEEVIQMYSFMLEFERGNIDWDMQNDYPSPKFTVDEIQCKFDNT